MLNSDLVIKFADILETPTIFPDEQGKVNVGVTNQGTAGFKGTLDINLHGSNCPLYKLSRLRWVAKLEKVNLKQCQSKTFTLDFWTLLALSSILPGLCHRAPTI